MDTIFEVIVSSRLPELVLVEDNRDDEDLTLKGIRRSGVECEITVKRDGEEALSLLLGPPPPADLILLDYKLPKLNGLQVLTELKRHDRTRFVPVVIFSGTNIGSSIKECYRIGANSCVTKPDEPAEYVDLVKWITHYWLKVNRTAGDDSNPQSRRIQQGLFSP